MRNLKRVLSLALALVMVLGMMVITTSAAKFDDADEITYTEAVDVMSAIGVITGDNGKFYPNRTLTREEGAAFICYMLMGKENADKLVGSGNFTDVAVDRWSAGEIDYCANLGIVKGVGNGEFNPKGELTAVQFGGMLLGALGYDGSIEGYTGANWASAISVDMIEIGLDLDGVAMGAQLTREQAAQMAFQALTKTLVGYEGGTKIEMADGTTVTVGATRYTYGTGESEYNEVTGADATTGKQFCEKYFPNLFLADGTDDDFGRPADHCWYVNKDKVEGFNPQKDTLAYNAMKTPAYTYDVTGRQDTDLAGIAEKLELEVADGTSDISAVKGDTVELYLDKGEIVLAIVLHTDLAKIVKVAKTTNEDAKYTYDVTVKVDGNNRSYTDKELEGFDVDTMVKDTYITIVENEDQNAAVVALADKITGKQTATGTGYIKVDGEKKEYTGGDNEVWNVNGAPNYADTYDFYLDAKGLIIGTVKVAAAKEEVNVFYVTDSVFEEGDTFGADKAQLAVTYLDGKKAILDVEITVDNSAKYVDVNGEDVALDNATDDMKGFYKYTLTDEGDVASITAVGTSYADEFVVLNDGRDVVFTKESANVKWKSTYFYADADTTVTTITNRGVTTITGYENFPTKTFTAGANVAVLMHTDDDALLAVYVIGAGFDAVAEDPIIGVYIETGDTTYDAAKAKYYTEVVYNVDGVDTTYTIEGQSVAADYKGLATITVTNGVAELSAASSVTANKAVAKVTDSYILVEGNSKPIYFASDVAFYDITNVTKNGVVADDEVVVGDIIRYTTKTVAGSTVIDTVYTTYAAQEDGLISIDLDSAEGKVYYTDVLGLNIDELNNFDESKSGDYVVYQYTRPADYTSLYAEVKYEDDTVDPWTADGSWDPDKVGTCGFLFYTDSDYPYGNYTFTIKIDDAVVMSGAFELAE